MKSKIKSSLNIEKKKISIEGKEILKRKLKQFKIKLDDKISIHMMKFFKINASNDLYYNVGIGKIDNKKIKQFVSDYNSSFIGFIRRRIGSNNKKVDKINEKNAQDLVTEVVRVNNADITELATSLTGLKSSRPDAQITVDTRTNTLILNDYSSILSGVVADFGCNHGACTIIASENNNIKELILLSL